MGSRINLCMMVLSFTREGASDGCEQWSAQAGERCPRRPKWEIFLAVAQGEVSQAEAARGWRVDVSVIIAIRRSVKDAALAALARKPGRQRKDRNFELEAARDESIT